MPDHRLAVFPGTFDPITLGHEDMLRRACALFDGVILAVAIAHHKKTLFTLDERLALARAALADLPQVQVLPFEGLVTEFAVAQGAQVMVRGLRSGSDFDYEFQLADMNRHLRPEVDTVFLTPDARWQSISSTLVREIATLGGKVQGLVSAAVLAPLLAKVGRQQ
ncbi:pantetheine-phosphate adenylyltransferase [Comamonas flocculans]|uniref:Phosphopantetheine adenylyltransferase n=1 Tax=Comamonas flocculans TaxID=2597701 RepID=A0A5B8RVX0_9BURK|nr:pantetheine-phosphate adenylyltransferase [Comamonas flocculans]QEA13640.1 pantetheine-phosphate adenylyltransferase [Comamonas flocculans]